MNFHFRLSRKIIGAVLVFSFIATNSFSQFRIGVKATTQTLSAKQSSRIYWEPVNNSQYSLDYISTRSSYGIGLTFFQEIGSVFIMGDVLYKKSTSEYRLSMTNDIKRESNRVLDRHELVTIPVIAGYRNKNLKIGLGPVFNVKMKSEYGLMDFEGFNMQGRKLNKGVQFLIGIKIKDHLQIDLRHELSFDSVGDDYNIVGNPLKLHSHPQSFSVSVGIYL